MRSLTRDRKKIDASLIICNKCGTTGGTLVKIDDHYEHQDKGKCRLMQFRAKPKGGK